ncbi:MAG: hypothetical protein QM788_01610 [Roseateles sp.]|uniref:PEP-CTERM sorting domain-containing protein n=1 Tax=Roseateles sp. TaxID=1971397 RepID=UPI0039ECE78A
MRATNKFLALALAAALQPATAGTVTLNFEDITSTTLLTDRYASQGITFTGDAWGVASVYPPCHGTRQFSRPGSCGALSLEVAPDAPEAKARSVAQNQNGSFTLSLAGGFVDEFSFAYSALPNAGVKLELLDAAGLVIDTMDSLKEVGCTEPGQYFCIWNTAAFKFAGTATALRVSGLAQGLLLDDMQFTAPGQTPGGTVPEPASIALAFGALAAAGWTRRRAAR